MALQHQVYIDGRISCFGMFGCFTNTPASVLPENKNRKKLDGSIKGGQRQTAIFKMEEWKENTAVGNTNKLINQHLSPVVGYSYGREVN